MVILNISPAVIIYSTLPTALCLWQTTADIQYNCTLACAILLKQSEIICLI